MPEVLPAFMSARRLAVIRVARERVGMAEEDYRAMLRRVAGVDSSRDLDGRGFDQVMAEFRRLGFTSDWYSETGGYRVGMASPGQLRLIGRLWGEFTDGQGNEVSLALWIESKFGVSSLRFLDAATAQKVVGALSRMVAKRRAPDTGEHVAKRRSAKQA